MYEDNAVSLQKIRSGLHILLDDKIPFYNLKKEVFRKLKNMDSFIYHTNTVLNFGKREMKDNDLKEFIELITENFKLNIIKIITRSPELKEISRKRGFKSEDFLEKSETEFGDNIINEDTLWIRKSVRSGQLIEYRGNIVILSDVNIGARIVAGGNVLVMGTLRGDVWAGKDMGEDSVVVASFFEPSQLRIHDTFLLKSNNIQKEGDNIPRVAYLKNNAVFVTEYKEWSLRGK